MSEKPTIIGLAGKAGAGKNTVADILNRMFNFEQLAFADALKAQAVALDPIVAVYGDRPYHLSEMGIALEEAKVKYPEVRRMLQRLGTEAGRDMFGQNIWVDRAFETMDKYPEIDTWVITDVRFRNEVEAIQAAGGTVFRVVRDDGHELGDNTAHKSEVELDEMVLPEIDNRGSREALEAEVWLAIATHFGTDWVPTVKHTFQRR